MKTSIIRIGNSKGVRIPEALLEESGLSKDVKLRVDDGKIIIEPHESDVDKGLLLSHSALAEDWDSTEESEAWGYLQ